MSSSLLTFPNSPMEMDLASFLEVFGGVYEHSPWVAQTAFESGLTEQHNTSEGLSESMITVIANADHKRLLDLINAHPDLAGKAAINGELTAESTSEQAGAGISECTPEEFEQFQTFNDAYKAKFGFPFIMAVKGSNRHMIFGSFVERLPNDPDTEFQTAVNEINKIARFRLDAIASGE
ncbi:MAG: 2-oxo-4-hydroxy-4-carboxy-5-ureidoimidazoline decarboxylase [Leucothrix sp.]